MLWIHAKIIDIKKWNDRLFTLIINAPINPFIAGQFTRLSYIQENNKRIQRAYSFVNTTNSQKLEFYILLIPNGIFTPKLLETNKEKFFISKNSFGFFTFHELPIKENIWMMATGTAIGPYFSILLSENVLQKFKKIILIYSIKHLTDLHYLDIFKKIKKKYGKKIIIKIILSQENNKKFLYGRITKLLQLGILESSVNEKLSPHCSHVMLCGNPEMIREMKIILKKKKNMIQHLRRKPGHITSENYW